uniref:Beta-1,4-glucuronyltransferase 1 n=1 Tax=Biomphalaria glabrata TaxID=6526 RepID=A0A2C9MA89_BIOGL
MPELASPEHSNQCQGIADACLHLLQLQPAQKANHPRSSIQPPTTTAPWLPAEVSEGAHRPISPQKKDQSHSAYVVPVFEIQGSSTVPRTKSELLDLWRKGLVRPFYWEACEKCQRPTDYERWKSLEDFGFVRIGYQVTRVDPWEPFYIAKTSLPLYDERFKQYGFNRISQANLS